MYRSPSEEQRYGAEAAGGRRGSGAGHGPLTARLADLRERLAGDAGLDGLSDDDRLEALHQIELLTRTASGVAVRLQAGFRTSQIQRQLADGVAPSRAGRAVGEDLALARMTSPYWGRRELTSACALVEEMPRTLSALDQGVISGYQARRITELTTCLSRQDRAEVDVRLEDSLPGIAQSELDKTVRSLVYEIDPKGFVERARKAAQDRGASLRPAPDVMGLLSARLPAPQAVAAYQSLQAAARAKKTSGDPRTLNQLMADELYERLTGRTVVDGIDVEVGLVITDTALFAGTSDPADLTGYGPVPAELARELLRPTEVEDEPEEETVSLAEVDGPARDQDSRDDRAPHARPRKNRPGKNRPGENRPGENRPGKDRPGENPPGEADLTTRARADARANAAGHPGGRVPAGFCPDGPRCTVFSCTLLHGAPPTGPGGAQDAGRGDGQVGHGEPVGSSTAEATISKSSSAAGARAARVWVRRLLSDPVTGVLADRDPRRRLFTGALRAFLIARDRTCRNAWCGAPVRHIDHITRHSAGGSTDEANGQGLCAHCNLARERPRHLKPPRETYRPPPPLLPILPRAPGGA